MLQQAVWAYDVLARIGADEFGLLLPNADRDGAAVVAERCRQSVEAAMLGVGDSESFSITLSVGVCCAPIGAAPAIDALMATADLALYQAKDSGRNHVVTLDLDCNAIDDRRRERRTGDTERGG